MKIALIRVLTIATLASSLSAFAATDESKHDSAVNASATTQAGCADSTTEGKKHKKATKPQRDDQDEQNFERTLMAIYG